MSAVDVDAAVVGAGLIGSAAAWALAGRGASVHVLERQRVGHRGGSSHGSSRIFRRGYPQAEYVRLTGRAQRRWAELSQEWGQPLLREIGGIDHGPDRRVRQIQAVFDRLGVSSELLTPEAAEARWPGMRFDDEVLYHPEAGVVNADATVRALIDCAVARGTEVSEGVEVECIERRRGAVAVHTSHGTVRAHRVVVAAGAWLPELMPDLTRRMPSITVTQQQVFHFVQRQPEVAWPVFIHKAGDEVYGLPSGTDGGPASAFKVAEHERGTVTTARTRSYRVDPASRQRMTTYVAQWLPGLVPEVSAETTCLYTTTDDRDFVLDRVDDIVIASPCSGHGAKFAPVLGDLLADLALGDSPESDRFALHPRRRNT